MKKTEDKKKARVKSKTASELSAIPRAARCGKEWFLFDAQGFILGKLAVRAAMILRGKHKPSYQPHLDKGDFVVVINAKGVKVTGKKETDKIYYRHSSYLGGLKKTTLETLRERHPERIIQHAVRGMLPHNKLGRKMFKKLKVYAGAEHPHHAQKPKTITADQTS